MMVPIRGGEAMSRPGASAVRWTAADVPDQRGRTAAVTGANSGLGFETARVLASRGATVVLACRDPGQAARAAGRIAAEAGPDAHDDRGARVQTLRLDLASLASVREAAEELCSRFPRLDLLINNAGVMMPPYGRTEDGFELQFGTNHLGHFALTGLVLGRLLVTSGSRVVTVSSNGHRAGRINVDDLQSERHYRKMRAYGQSKLANLMFTYELQRRLAAAGAPTIALAAHPGTSRTDLVRHLTGPSRAVANAQLGPLTSWFAQNVEMGALPILRAATDPGATGGQYYGPAGAFGFTGYPVPVESSSRSRDETVMDRLWEESEKLTGVHFPV
jgi:NAD(P)-dependent dehydrogenase (short-subunit alcohol dehydrogenase family)